MLLKFSSPDNLFFSLPFTAEPRPDMSGRENGILKPPQDWLQEANTIYGTKMELNFENTRHRYPWICSLRTKGVIAEHLGAVTLLSKPPQPSTVVGPAPTFARKTVQGGQGWMHAAAHRGHQAAKKIF